MSVQEEVSKLHELLLKAESEFAALKEERNAFQDQCIELRRENERLKNELTNRIGHVSIALKLSEERGAISMLSAAAYYHGSTLGFWDEAEERVYKERIMQLWRERK